MHIGPRTTIQMTTTPPTTFPPDPTLIIGAGPTGLLLGLTLLEYNISPIIIEQHPAHYQVESRALIIHAHTIQIFKSLGILESFLEQAIKIEKFEIYSNLGEVISELEVAEFVNMGAECDFILSLPQNETERILREMFVERGGVICWVVDVVNMVYSVKVDIVYTGEDEAQTRMSVEAKWVLAYDGAKSVVRETQCVSLDRTVDNVGFLIVSCEIEDDGRNVAKVVLSEEGTCIILKCPGEKKGRIVLQYPVDEFDTLPNPLTLDFIQYLVDQRCSFLDYTISNPDWMTSFSVVHRLNMEFRIGRIFFLGDAAHSHSPIGGKGMNSGFQEAYNLGWKLGLVQNGMGRSILI